MLVQNYDPVRLDYNNAVATTVEGNALTKVFQPTKKVSLPPRPNTPTQPPSYKGLYQAANNGTPANTNQFVVSRE